MNATPEIKRITKSEFDAMNPSRRLFAHDYPRRFAAIDFGGTLGAFGLSWRSDGIEPQIEVSDDGKAVWIGVDQFIAAIDVRHAHVAVSMPLNGNLLHLILEGDTAAVLTDDGALLFGSDFKVIKSEGLPDLPESASLEGGVLSVQFMDGDSIKLHI